MLAANGKTSLPRQTKCKALGIAGTALCSPPACNQQTTTSGTVTPHVVVGNGCMSDARDYCLMHETNCPADRTLVPTTRCGLRRNRPCFNDQRLTRRPSINILARPGAPSRPPLDCHSGRGCLCRSPAVDAARWPQRSLRPGRKRSRRGPARYLRCAPEGWPSREHRGNRGGQSRAQPLLLCKRN